MKGAAKGAAVAASAVAFSGCAASASEFQAQSRAELPEDLVSGYENWYATTCDGCGGGCGVIVRIVEGRAKKIEGAPDDPVNHGKTCVRGQAMLQRLYNPDRVHGPMQATGARGAATFGTTTWDTALAALVDRLKAAQGKAGAVVLITRPLRATQALVVQRFVQATGARWLMLEPFGEVPLKAAVKRVFGQEQLPEWDVRNAGYILNFGSDFLFTGPSPVHYGVHYGQFRQGAYAVGDFHPQARPRGHLTQVEPSMSYTGANADEWLQVRPGMEGVLALSIAQAILEGGKAAANPFGGALSSFSPEAVASRVGVTAERIRKTAQDFMARQPSLAIAGGQAGAYTNGADNLSAALALNLMAGSVGQQGGVIFNPPSGVPNLPPPGQPNPLGDWSALVDQLRAGQVELLLVHDADPVYELPPAMGFGEAVDRAGSIVSFSSFVDDTTAHANMVLPSHTHLEDWGADLPEASPGFPIVHFQQPVVEPFYDTRSFYDVLLTVSQGLPWATFKDAVMAAARDVQRLNRGSLTSPGFDQFWIQVRQRGGWWDTNPPTASPSPSGDLGELTSLAEPEFAGAAGDYPYFLVVHPSNSLGAGQAANLPWLQAAPDPITTAVWGTWVAINPRLGTQLGVREGDLLRVESPQGALELPAYINYAAPPDVVSVPLGQGHRRYGRYAQGRGANPLALLAPLTDSATGSLAYGSTRVRLTKTGRSVKFAKFEGTVPAFQIPGKEVAETVYGQK